MPTGIHTRSQRKLKPEPTKSREELRREKQRLEQSEPEKVQRQKLMASVADVRGKPPSKTKITAPPIVTDFMTTIEAAAYLRMSRQFLECARWRGDGSGPPYLKVGKSVRYRRSALDVWMSAHDHPGDKPGTMR